VLLPIAVAQALRRDRRWWDARILLVLVAAAASFRVFYWYYFDADAIAAKGGEDGTEEALRERAFDGSGFARIARTLWFYEPALLALVIVAVGAWFVSRAARAEPTAARAERGDVLVVLSFTLAYLAVFGMFKWTYERMLLPMVPMLAVFAAWGASTLCARVTIPARRALAAAFAVALGLPLFASTKLAWLRHGPTTLDDTAAWIRGNVRDPASEKLWVLPPLDFPFLRTLEGLRYPPGRAAFFSPWSRYQNKLDDAQRTPPLFAMFWLSGKPEFAALDDVATVDAYIRSHGPGIFVVQMIDEHQSPERQQVVASIRRLGTLLARISPDGDPRYTDHQLWDQDVEADGWRHVTWRVLQARAVGPVIEIYRIADR
jgi:4-amino-4-deoxy-L-arabinose transferase-like glycosyltransferase